MLLYRSRALLALFFLTALSTALSWANQATGANSDPTYQALRRPELGKVFSVRDLVVLRDAARFTFRSGHFALLAPVNGKVTGAVFRGEGLFTVDPPLPEEQRSLELLTREPEFVERFDELVLRFTDGTAEEITQAGSLDPNASVSSAMLEDVYDAGRKQIRYNFAARILQDVISPSRGGYFAAFVRGKRYNSKLLFILDPRGAEVVAPEEVSLETYDENTQGIWAAFHLAAEYASGRPSGTEVNAAIDIVHQDIRVEMERNGFLRGRAKTSFRTLTDGLRVVRFDLFSSLRVQQVTTTDGQELSFIQEDKDEDAQFWVILPEPVADGTELTIETLYEGKDAVRNEGNGNYYPVARSDWYPSNRFGDYSTYHLTFLTPKNLQIVATGEMVSEENEGDRKATVWHSDIPLAVAGFNLGEFRREQVTLGELGVTVESYANKNPSGLVRTIQMAAEGDFETPITGSRAPVAALGSMSTTQLVKKALAEAQLSTALFSDYFGPGSYKRISMTQQTACNYGQSWPGLVYLPVCYFFDTTVRHELGLDLDRGYWRAVAPHEVAHQWWGHTVGFRSYRDQWISEGFSDFSASLYIQLVWKKPAEFLRFWKEQQDLITERNQFGFRAVDVGPLTMGYRLRNSRVGFDITRRIIYPKGAFVLHMIRMMMWEPQSGDERFKQFMKDFVQTYNNRPASTEDLGLVLQKHMTQVMDLEQNHSMDWFFRQFVYGTAIPHYHLESAFAQEANGVRLTFKATQSGVDSDFRMLVPLYLELEDGPVIRTAVMRMIGNTTVEESVLLSGLTKLPRRAVLNYNYDVLSAAN